MKEKASEEVNAFAKEQKTHMVCATHNQLIVKIDLLSHEEYINASKSEPTEYNTILRRAPDQSDKSFHEQKIAL